MCLSISRYLVLGPAFSVSDMRSHNSLRFLAQRGEAVQLKTHENTELNIMVHKIKCGIRDLKTNLALE